MSYELGRVRVASGIESLKELDYVGLNLPSLLVQNTKFIFEEVNPIPSSIDGGVVKELGVCISLLQPANFGFGFPKFLF